MHSLPSSLSRLPLSAALLFLLLLSACSETLLREDQPSVVEASLSPKLRHQHLLKKAVADAQESDGTVDLILKLDDTVLNKQAVLHRYSVLHRYGVLHRYDYEASFNGMAITVPSDQVQPLLDDMADDPDISWVEASVAMSGVRQVVHGKESRMQTVPWSVLQIGAGSGSAGTWSRRDGVNIDIIIIDTGVSNNDINIQSRYNVPALMGGGDGVGRTKKGGHLDALFMDEDGHGTHIAGIAAAKDNGDGIIGVAPGARVHSVKITNNQGTTDIAAALFAVERITQLKLQNPHWPLVVSFAFGADIRTTAYNSLDEAIRRSIEAGVVYVLAAGNDGINASTVTPAHVDDAITVGAYDMFNRFAPFSNYGPDVDILAPGVDIPSLVPGGGNRSGTLAVDSGTSMAAAHVVGAAALYLSEHPRATPVQVRDALLEAGRSNVTGQPGETTDVSLYTGGL